MEAEVCVARFKTFIVSLDTGTALLQSKEQQILAKHRDAVMTALASLHCSTAVLPAWGLATQGATDTAAAKSVMEQHIQCIKACCAFMQALIARMYRIAPDPNTHNQVPATQELLMMLFLPMTTFDELPSSWPTAHYLLCNPQLYNTLDMISIYLLSLKPSLRRAAPPPGVALKAKYMMTSGLLLLHKTVMCLKPASNIVHSKVLAALPRGFTNNVCCLACEDLGIYLSDQEALKSRPVFWEEISVLLSLIMDCMRQAHDAADHQSLCKVLLGPGLLEAGRMLKFVYCSAAFQCEPGTNRMGSDLKDLMAWCGSVFLLTDTPGLADEYLQHLGQGFDKTTFTSKCGSSSANSRGSNSNVSKKNDFHTATSACLGNNTTARIFTPRIKVTDAHLKFVLSAESRSNPSYMVENTGLMFLIWSCAKCDLSNNLAHNSVGARDALCVAHHCSFQVLRWMREQHSRRLAEPHFQLGMERQHDNLSNVDCLNVSTVQGTKLGISELRMLMGCSTTDWPDAQKAGARL